MLRNEKKDKPRPKQKTGMENGSNVPELEWLFQEGKKGKKEKNDFLAKLMKKKLSGIMLIVISAVAGMIVYAL